MQLQQLVYFVAVADEGHFTRAADRVHVAQPSLSKQIAKLERELGASLFSRARGHVALTPAGEALLPLARRILADVESAPLEVGELISLQRGRLRLGATPSLCTVLVPQSLRAFHDQFPGIDLVVEEGGSRDLVHKLAEAELDLALIVVPLQTHDPALAISPLLRERLLVAVPADHALAGRAAIAVTELRRWPLVMFRDGYDLREATIEACRRAGFNPRFAVEGGEMDAALEFAEAGLGPAVVPSLVLALHPRLRGVSLKPRLERTIAFAHRRDVGLPRAAREFAVLLRGMLAERHQRGRLPEGARLVGGDAPLAPAHRPIIGAGRASARETLIR